MDKLNQKVKAPFPYHGGKSRVASVVWDAFGDIENYVEPFAGSLAVLLAANKIPKIETINDKDCLLINFWRATSNNPDGVIKYADFPVHEAELHARHQYLNSSITDEFLKKMHSDPDFYDVKLAGYWVWGMGASVGDNWLKPKGLNAAPLLSSAGGGIHGMTHTVSDWINALSKRLRRVRMCCGDWTKLVTPAVTYKNVALSKRAVTGLFLDPPYLFHGRDKVYREEENVYAHVCAWAIANSDNPELRIAVCGYDGDYEFPASWRQYNWQTQGGMANLGDGRGKQNSKREVIYFSPYCL